MSALSKVSEELKSHIKEDYLSGMSVPDIATKYGFKYPRTCYFHLQPLSPQDKLTHAQGRLDTMRQAMEGGMEVANE